MTTIKPPSIIIEHKQNTEKIEVCITSDKKGLSILEINTDKLNPFRFEIKKEDWSELKKFIDAQLEKK